MFVIGQLFSSLAVLFSMVFKILYFLLVLRIIISWFRVDSFSEPVSLLYRVTDPLLLPLKRLPLQIGMIDFSPILAFLALTFLDHFLVGLLQQIAYRCGVMG